MRGKWIQRGLLAVIVLLALVASAQNLLATRDLGSVRDDPVADWEARFAAVKQRLPFRRGVVGYISDSSVPGATFDPANDEGEYVLTQYVMAPIIIVKGTDQEWNIANLDRATFEQWSKSHGDKFEVTSLKGGLYLLHRTGN
ncbi:MAG: hypothetical protein ACM3MF_08620 [Anaerolineae bacterium]